MIRNMQTFMAAALVVASQIAQVGQAEQDLLVMDDCHMTMMNSACFFAAMPITDDESNHFDVSRYAEGSSLELLRQAAAQLPIPETVMDARVRAYRPTEDELYFTIPDGRYVNRIYSGVKLREQE